MHFCSLWWRQAVLTFTASPLSATADVHRDIDSLLLANPEFQDEQLLNKVLQAVPLLWRLTPPGGGGTAVEILIPILFIL